MNLRIAGCVLIFYLIAALVAVLYILKNRSHSAEFGIVSSQRHDYTSNKFDVFSPLESQSVSSRALHDAPTSREVLESAQDKKYWNQWAPINLSAHLDHRISSEYLKPRISYQSKYVVDMWSNNGLGDYIWQHLMLGELKMRPDQLYHYGEKIFSDVKYRYKGGGGLDIAFLPDTTENAVFILNGRDNITASTAKAWLDGLLDLDLLQNVGLVLIGDELCNNHWLLPYLQSKNRTAPKFVFLVYDSPLVNNANILQFPLGVATYRNFPLPGFPDLVVTGTRKYMCNFMGTVYSGSSREHLAQTIHDIHQAEGKDLCYLRTRQVWQPEETADSLSSYVDILKSSDLTLCPVGRNSESYRIYEAMSVGSVPVIEDIVVNVSCAATPFRLLKQHRAPVIFVKKWSELTGLIKKEQQMSLKAKERRREELMMWYKVFRKSLTFGFINTVSSNFFGVT